MRRLFSSATASAALALAVSAIPAAVSAQTSATAAVVEDFSEESVGSAPTSFSAPIGWWSISTDGVDTKPVLFEDGTRYATATGANSIATQAQAQAQGQNVHQLSDFSGSFNYFPLAIFNKVPNYTQGSVVTRFAIVGGDLDTEAGIAFNYQPNGDYLVLRLDADESSLELYSVVQGQASALDIVENVPTALARWHDLQLTVPTGGTHVTGLLDGQRYLDVDLTSPISGKVGAWSKTDTVVVFNSFTVDPNAQ
jgi:hypothetical protein